MMTLSPSRGRVRPRSERAPAARPEGPAVLRLRMLELEHALRLGALDEDARRGAQETVARLRAAVLERPALTFADLAARLRTQGDEP